MQKNSERNHNSRISGIELNSVDAEKEKKKSQNNFVELLPPEVTFKIFSQLDIGSLCRASLTCKSWNNIVRNSDSLRKPHCLTLGTVCQREIDDDLESGYSWRISLVFVVYSVFDNVVVGQLHLLHEEVILLRNYQKSKVKHEWLSGRYSNICSPLSLPEKIMYPMDVDTWGEILEAELERKAEKLPRSYNFETLKLK
ncbi:F-box only protein 48 [Mustela lutreola]|uniref:F-box only protein 48 n=1 Tax=Mustela lutreola TaxID=9666 RepID=UPI0027974293|nr:F-box only protein 48 [Mustela lutreola]